MGNPALMSMGDAGDQLPKEGVSLRLRKRADHQKVQHGVAWNVIEVDAMDRFFGPTAVVRDDVGVVLQVSENGDLGLERFEQSCDLDRDFLVVFDRQNHHPVLPSAESLDE